MQWRTKAHYGAVTIPAVTILWDSPLAFLQGPEPAHRTMHRAASNCSSLLATQSPSGVEATFQDAGWCAHQLCVAAAPCSIHTL